MDSIRKFGTTAPPLAYETKPGSDLQGRTSVGIQAFLGEFWALFQEMMLPGWNGNDPICWRCRTTSADMLEVDNNARCRRTPFILSYPGRPSYQGGCIRWHAV